MTTDTLRQITGVLRTPEGSAFPNKTLTWFRERRVVQAQGSSVVLDEPFFVVTDAVGAIDHDVMAGNYLVLVRLKDTDRYFRVSVPDQAGPFNIADLVDAPPVTPEIITQVQALVIEARAWAENPEDTEVEPGKYSAKHHAVKAQAASEQAALFDGPKVDTFAELASVTPAQLSVGGYIRVIELGAVYQRAADAATDGHLDYSGTGGVKLYVLPGDGGYNVKAFGAPSDGLTDAAAAFQKAHDALPSTGGKIFVPAGVYLWQSTVTFSKSAIAYGEGFSAIAGGIAATQVYKGASVSGPALILSGLESGVMNIGFEGRPGNVGDGIHVINGRTTLKNVSSHRMGRDGVRVGAATQTNCNHFNHTTVICRENGRHGYHVDDEFYRNNTSFGANCNNGVIKHVDATDNGGDGILINGGWYNAVENFLPQVNAGAGLRVENTGVTNIGARFTLVLGGEQNEGNVGGNIVNTGFNSVLLGITPGVSLTDTGINTIIFATGLSKVDTLNVYNILTAERPTSGTFDYPIIAKVFGNATDGRGGGFEIQTPAGSGASRVAARIAAAQDSGNNDRLTFFLNTGGTMVEYLRLSPILNALFPVSDDVIDLGRSGNRFNQTFSKEFRPGDGAPIWTSGAGVPAIAAPVGSLYTRTDGGAGTTLYVKESGTGTAGWVGK